MNRKHLRKLISIYNENSQQGGIVGMYLNMIKPIYNKPMLNITSQFSVQHSRPPCPSPTPRVYSNSCPLDVTILQLNIILC